MGGKFSRAVARSIKNYNIEDRAQRALARNQEVARPAPRYPSEAARQKEPVQVQKQHQLPVEDAGPSAAAMPTTGGMPTADVSLHAKDEGLNDRLKGLYVQAVGEGRPVVGSASGAGPAQRKLPEDRRKVAETEHGYEEPRAAPPRGLVTLKQALELIGSHYVDKKQFNAAVLAKQYNLDVRQAQQLLKYFQSYNLAMPKKDTGESPAGPVPGSLPPKLQPPAQTAKHPSS